MKTHAKLAIIALMFSLMLISTIMAQDKTHQLSFNKLDRVWFRTSFLKNNLKLNNCYFEYGTDSINGSMNMYVSQIDTCKIIMLTFSLPGIFNSDEYNIRLKVNGHFINIPRKLLNQQYDNPKIIFKKIIIRVHSGFYPGKNPFYVVIEPNGNNYYYTKSANEAFYDSELTDENETSDNTFTQNR